MSEAVYQTCLNTLCFCNYLSGSPLRFFLRVFSQVFKTGAINRSTTPPDKSKITRPPNAGKQTPSAASSPRRPQSSIKSPEASINHRPSSRTRSTFTSMGKFTGSTPISTTRARSPSTLLLFTPKRSGESCPPITPSKTMPK